MRLVSELSTKVGSGSQSKRTLECTVAGLGDMGRVSGEEGGFLRRVDGPRLHLFGINRS